MNKKGIISIIVIIVVIVVALIYYFGFFMFQQNGAEEVQGEATNTYEASPDAVTAVFTDPQTEKSVTVVFDEDVAILSGDGFDGVMLTRARSADGARYISEEDLELWNKGDTVQISRGGEVVFTGNVGGQTDAEKMTSNTWTWQATTLNGEVIEPEQAEAFTISFDAADGTMHATTDCNAIFGPYELGADHALTFGALGMTKKFCEGSQEQSFADGLSKVESFYFNGSGALVLTFASSSNWMLFSR